jgi:exoribonuclease R
LADRYASEACLSLAAGQEVPDWVRTALPKLPAVMNSTDRKASSAQHAAVDLAEAVLLQGRVGEEFEAAVLDVGAGRHHHNSNVPVAGGTVAVDDPPVRARCEGALPLGERIRVRLITADPQRRLVVFSAAD